MDKTLDRLYLEENQETELTEEIVQQYREVWVLRHRSFINCLKKHLFTHIVLPFTAVLIYILLFACLTGIYWYAFFCLPYGAGIIYLLAYFSSEKKKINEILNSDRHEKRGLIWIKEVNRTLIPGFKVPMCTAEYTTDTDLYRLIKTNYADSDLKNNQYATMISTGKESMILSDVSWCREA